MSDLGALLRKAREQRGYTLEDIQEYTKIRKRYLEAIETGDYKVLPGSFYVRAFVKTYAETVGLDAEEVLRLYQKELPKAPTVEHVPIENTRIKPGKRSVQHNDRWGKVAVTLLMWAFPILIAAVIYVYVSNNNNDTPNELDPNTHITDQSSPASPTPTPTPSATPTPTPTPTPDAVALTLTRTGAGGVQYYDVTPGTSYEMQIVVTERCWVEVRKGSRTGEKKFYKNSDAQTLTFTLDGPYYVNIGRSDFATITIGGQAVDDGDKSTSSKFIFAPAADADANENDAQ